MEKWLSVEIIPGSRGGRIKENGRGGEFSMIYCKNFCKCHNVCPPSTTVIKNKQTKNQGEKG
jgi:hypothetical protein